MMNVGMTRYAAIAVAFTLVLGACSGGTGKKEAASAVGPAADTSAARGDNGAAKSADTGGKTVATGGAKLTTTNGTTTLTTPSGVKVTKTSAGAPIANLFSKAEDKIGITPGKIVFCGHAATTFGPAFNTSERDLNVYWEEVGKIFGRTVEVTYENDNYDPTTAVQAAQACKQKNPFIFFGGIGFDQIPAVRKFAEDNHMFYVHHIARLDLKKKYSFSPLPSVEQVGDFAGQWVATHWRGKKVGIIYRDSENWDPGRATFIARLKKENSNTIVAQRGVMKNQGSYVTELNELHTKGAELVFVWENALAATAIVQEAKGQNWNPQFLIFPFNTTTDAIGNQALNPPVQGISVWPAYSPGDYSGPFASYAKEIKHMEQVYAKRRPNTTVTDIHWMVWLSYRDLHHMLLACGKDCTRNKLLGLFLWKKYTYQDVAPSCPVDYTRNGHVGGFWATMFTAYQKPDGKVGWRHIPNQVCRDSFLK
jgi:ABC-type branched-subunit amino acid transport system substrate-binding protein